SKMVDFQICDYGSPAKDVIFFIYSSLKKHVVEKHYEEILELYYETFIRTLKELKCDSSAFTRKVFQNELNFEAVQTQFAHIAYMIPPIYAKKGTVQDFDKLTPENIGAELTDLHIDKYIFICNEFAKKNWI